MESRALGDGLPYVELASPTPARRWLPARDTNLVFALMLACLPFALIARHGVFFQNAVFFQRFMQDEEPPSPMVAHMNAAIDEVEPCTRRRNASGIDRGPNQTYGYD